MSDLGLTHVALPIRDAERSIDFYARYARMEVVHRRQSEDDDREVLWLSDRTRPFVVVLVEMEKVAASLGPFAHLGVGCASREEVDRLVALAREEGVLSREPEDSGYPIGYWAFLLDPDGHTLELSFGQEIGLTIEGAGGID